MRVLSGAFLLGDLVTQVDQVTRYNFVQMQMSYFRELLKLEVFPIRPGRKFCVSDIRQSQEYHVINVHIWGLFPLVTAFPGGWGGMRAEGRECRHGLPGTLFQGDQPTLRSANMMSS